LGDGVLEIILPKGEERSFERVVVQIGPVSYGRHRVVIERRETRDQFQDNSQTPGKREERRADAAPFRPLNSR
jgi:hypothetical protein